MRKLTKRSTAVLAAVAVVAVGGGAAAWAAGWGINGTGTATAQGAEIQPLEATAAVSKNIYPGLQTTIIASVKNPNEFPVQLTGSIQPKDVTVTGTSTGSADDCKNGILTAGVLNTSFPGNPRVEAKQTNSNVSSSISIGENLPEACAGKTIKVDYSFTAVSKA